MSLNCDSPIVDKSKRYDRQLRLWGEAGQQALEKAHICLINANIVGTEILKSLVLPGLGAFTIVDDRKVTENDYDNNFFLCCDKQAIGRQSRARIATQNLLEMNDDVKSGKFIEESFESILESNANFFEQFTLVIACGIESSRSISLLSEICWKSSIPLLLVKSVGFFGYIRLQVREHCIVEAKSDDYLEDYRIEDIFPDLKDYFNQLPDFDSMKREELIKVPSLAIIYRAMNEWMAANNRREVPKTYSEKQQLRRLIKEKMFHFNESKEVIVHIEGGDDENSHDQTILAADMENFLEAEKFVNKVFTSCHKVSSGLERLLAEVPNLDVLERNQKPVSDSSKCSNTPNFWFLMSVLKQFVLNNGCLPLSGIIGDMNCGSEHYVSLLSLYRKKAMEDVGTMMKMIQQHSPSMVITEQEVQSFCRNANYLTVIRTSEIAKELDKESQLIKQFPMADDELHVYMMIKLAERFYSKHCHWPGETDCSEKEREDLKRELKELNTRLGTSLMVRDERLFEEICRYGGCELHSISGFVGACAAQEAIKLISGQYIPIRNTFVYNATNCRTEVYDL